MQQKKKGKTNLKTFFSKFISLDIQANFTYSKKGLWKFCGIDDLLFHGKTKLQNTIDFRRPINIT